MKRKQKQDAAGGRSGGSKVTKSGKGEQKPVTLPSLWTLPEEIRNIVLSRACSKHPKADYATSSSRWKVNLDTKMVLSLMLVSRDLYDYFQPLLWTHVRIEKPSALFQLHAALSSCPANGAFIKSLHLGPLSGLDDTYWPVRMKEEDDLPFTGDEPMAFFKTGLT